MYTRALTHTHTHNTHTHTHIDEDELEFSLPLLLTPPDSPFSLTDSPCSPSDIHNRLSTLHHGTAHNYPYKAINSTIMIEFSPLIAELSVPPSDSIEMKALKTHEWIQR